MESNELLEMVVSFTKTLSSSQFNSFIKVSNFYLDSKNEDFFIKSKKELNYIKKSYALKDLSLEINEDFQNLNDDQQMWVSKIYSDEIFKINSIIQNDNLLKKINGAKIFISGETGTGKTSIVKKILQDNPSIDFNNEIIFANLISYKMGQSQINLINLANELKNVEKKTIIFIDEMDSIITNRENSDLGEHRRIIGTFLNFLDELSWNIILIAATNHKKVIDSAVIRRFNIIFETRTLHLDEFFDLLSEDGIKMEKGKEETIKSLVNKFDFSFSDLISLKNEKIISDNLYFEEKLENWELFIKTFQEFIDKNKFINFQWSVRDKKAIRKHHLLKGVKIDDQENEFEN